MALNRKHLHFYRVKYKQNTAEITKLKAEGRWCRRKLERMQREIALMLDLLKKTKR